MSFIPNTDDDRRAMLDKIGVKNFNELIGAIPDSLRLNRPLDIPMLSEMELLAEIDQISKKNSSEIACFAGAGIYDHFIPAAEFAAVMRPEFMTAYTPYQPEVAQGTLQLIYEFQTHICRLTGMDVSNASLYDGASAAAEAVILACAATKRKHIVLSETVNPMYRQVIATYLAAREVSIETIPMKEGLTDFNRLQDAVNEETACVMLGQPNFFGLLEDIETAERIIHGVGGKLIMTVDPIAQALLKTPGEYGADIAVGEGQPLGIPISFGGPLVGFFAVKKELIRNLPGRIAARTKDVDGRPGFVLTLQTREQHIRRDKATSNICTNQAFCATMATAYMSLLGKTGLKKVALLSAEKAQRLARGIFALGGYRSYFKAPFVREFAVETPRPAAEIISALVERGVLPGVDAGRWFGGMDNCLIVATTEKRTDAEIDRMVSGLKELTSSGVLSRM
ncbi:MAG: aminomethyl-transferring glycine dehydrogenase subunit GcvPA [candidate division Zixibacteria bacterium]|nr:aminomethyl-transferring glycine dehydrogenase subunit GcvPA [candidate division Zixibacteria bacterium]